MFGARTGKAFLIIVIFSAVGCSGGGVSSGTSDASSVSQPVYKAYVETDPELLEAYNSYVQSGGTQTEAEWGEEHYETVGQVEGRVLPDVGDEDVALNEGSGRLKCPTNENKGQGGNYPNCACSTGYYYSQGSNSCLANPCGTGAVLDDASFRLARDLWFSDRVAAVAIYGHISTWDVSSVTNMRSAFSDKESFNEDISSWCTGSITRMDGMFYNAVSFNQPIGKWDTGNVTDMRSMFMFAASFNQPLGNWDTGRVTRMDGMFKRSGFNKDISRWDTSSVTRMHSMFREMPFNQDISSWDVSRVNDMDSMFMENQAFNQDLSGWNVGNVNTCVWFDANSSYKPSATWTKPRPGFTSCAP